MFRQFSVHVLKQAAIQLIFSSWGIARASDVAEIIIDKTGNWVIKAANSKTINVVKEKVAENWNELKKLFGTTDDYDTFLTKKWGDGISTLQAAINRGMRIIKGADMPDQMVGVTESLGKPMTRDQIREAIHIAKKKMGIGPAEDLICDYSGGMWDSRTGEYIGKIWEKL